MIDGEREISARRRRRNLEFRCEIAAELTDGRMVADHRLGEGDDLRILALLHGDLTRFDIPAVGGIEDSDDRRVIERGGPVCGDDGERRQMRRDEAGRLRLRPHWGEGDGGQQDEQGRLLHRGILEREVSGRPMCGGPAAASGDPACWVKMKRGV
jgi:hypothetical protein